MAPGRTTSPAELVSALLTTGRIVDRRIEAAVAGTGLTADSWRILDLVARTPGRSMREISERLALPAATVTRLVDQLVAVGYAYRGVAPQDRRCVILHPTDPGRSALRGTRRAANAVADAVRVRLAAARIDAGALAAALDAFTREA